jgi:hypothetical protein
MLRPVMDRIRSLAGRLARRGAGADLAIRLVTTGGIMGLDTVVTVDHGQVVVQSHGKERRRRPLSREEIERLEALASAVLAAPEPVRGGHVIYDAMSHDLDVSLHDSRRVLHASTGDDVARPIWDLVRAVTELER